MHRRMLPIASPCHAFRPAPGRTFCGKCETHVHDLSAMTGREATRFLAAHVGERICVAYRTAKDGTILVRPEPRAKGGLLVALGLAACTGHAPDVEHPGERCRDPHGYEIDCRDESRADVLVVPDESALATSATASGAGARAGNDIAVENADAGAMFDAFEGVAEEALGLAPTEPVAPRPDDGEPRPDDGEMVGRVEIDRDFERRLAKHDRRAARAERREARRERKRIRETANRS